MNIEAKQFYPARHVKPGDAKKRNRRGKGARWVARERHSGTTIAAPAAVEEDGDAEARVIRDDEEAGPEPVIEVGDAMAPVVEEIPLESDGKRAT